MAKNKKNLYFFAIFFLTIFAFAYLTLKIYLTTKNVLLTSFIIAIFILLSYVTKNFLERINVPHFSGKTALRYTMLCRSCGWEWMSHTTDKKPSKCPNCGEKDNLEVLGWRKVRIPLQKVNKDLRAFFRQKLFSKD